MSLSSRTEIAGLVEAGETITIPAGIVFASATAIVTPLDKEPTIPPTLSISISFPAASVATFGLVPLSA